METLSLREPDEVQTEGGRFPERNAAGSEPSAGHAPSGRVWHVSAAPIVELSNLFFKNIILGFRIIQKKNVYITDFHHE